MTHATKAIGITPGAGDHMANREGVDLIKSFYKGRILKAPEMTQATYAIGITRAAGGHMATGDGVKLI